MNKNNLITLGAIAQKQFKMKDDFKIMEVASDDYGKVKILIPHHPAFSDMSPYALPPEFDVVTLIQFATQNNREFIWCGYSEKANTLVIKEG